jgi:hypothetical protein
MLRTVQSICGLLRVKEKTRIWVCLILGICFLIQSMKLLRRLFTQVELKIRWDVSVNHVAQYHCSFLSR